MQLLVEHSSIPGTLYEDCLMYGGCGAILNEMDLNESTDSLGRNVTTFRGKFQEAGVVNKNKRMYTKPILNSNVDRLEEALKDGGLIGELDHPSDSIIHFYNSSHKVTRLWWEGNVLMGEGNILNTPCGKILKTLINDGVRVGISSRGVGNGKVNEEGILVIGESYKLITFDAVADPSTHAAFQKRVAAKRENHTPQASETVQTTDVAVKNEGSGIDISKELVIACFGGIVKSKTGEILSEVN